MHTSIRSSLQNELAVGTKRKRILIAISSDLYKRNFVDSGALSELAKAYELCFLLSSAVKLAWPNTYCVKNDDIENRTKKRWRLQFITMKRFASRSSTFAIKYKEHLYRHLNSWNKFRFQVVSLPGIAELFVKMTEISLGTLKEVDRYLDEINPDFAIVPSGFLDSFSSDCIKSLKKRKIKHLMLMGNWDNVSSKGVLTVKPDYLGVWGEQGKEAAFKIHQIPSERVFILGSPQFEVYFKKVIQSKVEFCHLNLLPVDKRILLYVGTSRWVDEIAILSHLDKAIENDELSNVHVHYRPHPWKEISSDEKNFFDCGFKYTTMDHQLIDHYQKLLTDPAYKTSRNGFMPEYSYYLSLFNAVDAVICPLTTMGIEAMIAGKPVMLHAFPNEAHNFSAADALHYEHHKAWSKMPSVLICRDRAQVVAYCQKLLTFVNAQNTSEKVRDEVRYVVHHDNSLYCERLAGCVRMMLTIDNN